MLWDGLGGSTAIKPAVSFKALSLNLPAQGAGADKAQPAMVEFWAPPTIDLPVKIGAPLRWTPGSRDEMAGGCGAAGLRGPGRAGARGRTAPGVNDAAVTGSAFPATLDAYGFFADAARQKPCGPRRPTASRPRCGRTVRKKLRFVYVPVGQQAKARGRLDRPAGWFPR